MFGGAEGSWLKTCLRIQGSNETMKRDEPARSSIGDCKLKTELTHPPASDLGAPLWANPESMNSGDIYSALVHLSEPAMVTINRGRGKAKPNHS